MHLSRTSARRSFGALFIILTFIAMLALPVSAAPVKQDAQAVITAPTDGQAVNGIITISGSASHPDFERYELAYGPDPNPNDAWQNFAGNNQQVSNNTLGSWNTNVVADGTYIIRLRVIRHDSNYNEAFVRGIKVSNQQPIGTPTSIPVIPTFGPESTIAPISTIVIEQPPTSVPAAASNSVSNTNASNSTRNTNNTASGGVTVGGLMGSACLTGLGWTALAFILFGAVSFGRIQYKRYLRQQRKKISNASSQSTPPPSA
jgi:flagellar biogenesis protein FliO